MIVLTDVNWMSQAEEFAPMTHGLLKKKRNNQFFQTMYAWTFAYLVVIIPPALARYSWVTNVTNLLFTL